jgi:hypothetical protein
VSIASAGVLSQGSSARWTWVVQDETGTAIPAASLSTFILTHYAVVLGQGNITVNSVFKVNILNTGRGTVDASGNVVVTMTPADMTILNSPAVPEIHVFLVEWTYAAGVKQGSHGVQFTLLPVVDL